MKATELMRGDLVYTNKDYIRVTIIEEIYSHSILTKEVEYESEEIDENDIRPIPLTPEILKKNGWVLKEWNGHKQFQYTVEECGDEIIYKIDYEGPHFIVSCFRRSHEIVYVHNLQHLLKECGIKNDLEV